MKKKGEFLKIRNKHRANQALFDAFKRLRTEPEVWVTWHGERLKLVNYQSCGDEAGLAVIAHFGRFGFQIGQETGDGANMCLIYYNPDRGEPQSTKRYRPPRPLHCRRPLSKGLAVVVERHKHNKDED